MEPEEGRPRGSSLGKEGILGLCLAGDEVVEEDTDLKIHPSGRCALQLAAAYGIVLLFLPGAAVALAHFPTLAARIDSARAAPANADAEGSPAAMSVSDSGGTKKTQASSSPTDSDGTKKAPSPASDSDGTKKTQPPPAGSGGEKKTAAAPSMRLSQGGAPPAVLAEQEREEKREEEIARARADMGQRPSDPEPLGRLVDQLIQGHRGAEAVEAAKGFVSQNLSVAGGYLHLGRALFWSGDYSLALLQFQRAISLDPKDSNAQFWQCRVQTTMG